MLEIFFNGRHWREKSHEKHILTGKTWQYRFFELILVGHNFHKSVKSDEMLPCIFSLLNVLLFKVEFCSR